MRVMSRILILKTGETAVEVQRTDGDYDRWFTDAMSSHPLQFDVCDITRADLTLPPDCCGVIVTGSPKAAYRHEPWMERLGSFLRESDQHRVPLLGVCFGAQILAMARGGRVILNPEGWEIGGARIELTAAGGDDPLFAGLPRKFGALTTHEDRIERLPEGAILLASNASSPVQAFRLGESTWGVQFHPEATPNIIETLIRLRSDRFSRDAVEHGRDPNGHLDRLVETARDPSALQGRTVLDNFARLCVERNSR